MRALILAGLIAGAAQSIWAQGGPPMITDDPGTPGGGKWEINLSATFEHRSGETLSNFPGIDLNYGVGEHLQLTLQGGPVFLKRSGHGLIGGLGGTEAAVKWRFLDEERSGFDVSMFPRVIFNVIPSSARRGLADDGTRFQIPFEAAKSFGRWHADAEFGPLVSTVGRSEWLYGIVGGFDLTKGTALMAELNGTSGTDFSDDVLTVNLGIRHAFTAEQILIVSLGKELRSPDQPRAVLGYFGMQLLY